MGISSDVADVIVSDVKQSISVGIAHASEQAQTEGDFAAHAALSHIQLTLGELHMRIDAAAAHVKADVAVLLAKLKALL